MTTKNCLNCDKELTGNFCAGCGQKADTHRISFKNFIFHDLLHGTFHIEKGMFFTASQALTRPGKASLDYISGKRKPYYNVFYFILLTIAVMLFIRHVDELFTGPAPEMIRDTPDVNEATRKLDQLFAQKSKLLLLLFVPLAALNSFILFRRKKLNLSEHSILSGMILLGILLISVLANILFLMNMVIQFDTTWLSLVVTAVIFIYVGFGYVNAFGTDYSKWGMVLRIVLFNLLICFETFILLVILVGIATDWKFTQVTIAPFS
jgi:hypothetical protein